MGDIFRQYDRWYFAEEPPVDGSGVTGSGSPPDTDSGEGTPPADIDPTLVYDDDGVPYKNRHAEMQRKYTQLKRQLDTYSEILASQASKEPPGQAPAQPSSAQNNPQGSEGPEDEAWQRLENIVSKTVSREVQRSMLQTRSVDERQKVIDGVMSSVRDDPELGMEVVKEMQGRPYLRTITDPRQLRVAVGDAVDAARRRLGRDMVVEKSAEPKSKVGMGEPPAPKKPQAPPSGEFDPEKVTMEMLGADERAICKNFFNSNPKEYAKWVKDREDKKIKDASYIIEAAKRRGL